MKLISTRIETKQIELMQANEEIAKGSKCYKDYLFVDVLGDEFVAYPTPEAAISDFGRMVSDILYDENYPECNGEICFCVNVVVDAYRRDNDEPSFSACDKNEVSHLILDNRKKKEAESAEQEEANKDESDKEDDGLTMIEGLPYKANKLVYHDIKKEVPAPNMTVVALTKNGCWFAGRFDYDTWKFKDGSDFDPGLADDEVVAWFKVPLLHKIQ